MTTENDGNSNGKDLSVAQYIVCACTGACVTSLFVTPLDVIKIRIQSQEKKFHQKKCFLYCNGLMDHICYCPLSKGVHPYYFNGTLDAFVKIGRYEGVSSFWSGLPPTLVMAVPSTVLYFTLYDKFKRNVQKYFPSVHYACVPAICGSSARVAAVIVTSPIELVRTKLQSEKLKYLDIQKGVKDLINQQGILSLWKGCGSTIFRDVPFSALYWTGYETSKQLFNQEHPTFIFSFLAGSLSGGIAAVLTAPFDVIKTHRQIELGETYFNKKNFKYSLFGALKKTYQVSGIKSLYAGIVPRLLKVAPSCAIMISTYEYGKSYFHNYNKAT